MMQQVCHAKQHDTSLPFRPDADELVKQADLWLCLGASAERQTCTG